MYIYICIYIYIYVYINVGTFYLCLYLYLCICVYIYIYICVCVYTFIYGYYLSLSLYIYIYIYIYVCISFSFFSIWNPTGGQQTSGSPKLRVCPRLHLGWSLCRRGTLAIIFVYRWLLLLRPRLQENERLYTLDFTALYAHAATTAVSGQASAPSSVFLQSALTTTNRRSEPLSNEHDSLNEHVCRTDPNASLMCGGGPLVHNQSATIHLTAMGAES